LNRREEWTVLFVIVTIIGYALYNYGHEEDEKRDKRSCGTMVSKSSTTKRMKDISSIERELSSIGKDSYTLSYIEGVVRNGSDTLGFPGGVMEGGYLKGEDLSDVACYVLELSGGKCPHDYSGDAHMLFTSNCGGCHGNDGKGLNGSYPNLTRRPLLGIEKRKERLERDISSLKR